MVEGIKDILAELLRTGKDVLECCEQMSQVGLCTTNPNIRYCRLFPGCRIGGDSIILGRKTIAINYNIKHLLEIIFNNLINCFLTC